LIETESAIRTKRVGSLAGVALTVCPMIDAVLMVATRQIQNPTMFTKITPVT